MTTMFEVPSMLEMSRERLIRTLKVLDGQEVPDIDDETYDPYLGHLFMDHSGNHLIPVEMVGFWSLESHDLSPVGRAKQWAQLMFERDELIPSTTTVPLDDIHYTAQEDVRVDALLHYVLHPDGERFDSRGYFVRNVHPVLLYTDEHGYVVMDGCHRTSAAKMRGDRSIEAYVLEVPTSSLVRATALAFQAFLYVNEIVPGGAGLCYGATSMVAASLLRRDVTPTLVHGLYSINGDQHPHYWLEVDGYVVDPTRPQFEPGTLVTSPEMADGVYVRQEEVPLPSSDEDARNAFADAFQMYEAGYEMAKRFERALRIGDVS